MKEKSFGRFLIFPQGSSYERFGNAVNKKKNGHEITDKYCVKRHEIL